MSEYSHADIIKRLDQLEEKLAPLFDAWTDVAALGRTGRIVGRAVMWTAAMVVSVMAAYTVLTGGFA